MRLGIIGAGDAARRQIEGVRELNRKISIECLVDNDLPFLKQQAKEFEIEKVYQDYRAALSDSKVDAVSICLPHNLHCPVAIEAAEAGKHILVTKPIALKVEEAKRMIAAAEENRVRLYVGENEPYAPIAKTLRQIYRSEELIGETIFATLVAGMRMERWSYPGRRAWLAKPQMGGTGTWMLHGVHSVAQLRFIFGEVTTVYMREHHAHSFANPEVEGTMSGTLTLENGINLSFVQTCENKSMLHGYRLYGERGVVQATKKGYQIFSPDSDSAKIRPYVDQALSDYAEMMEAFLNYVSGKSFGPTTAESETRSVAVVEAGYESAKSGMPIDLKSRFRDI